MGLFDFIGPASGLLFTLENIIWINLGVFIGCVFAAIPGLSVILCIILFLPVTYTMRAIPGMMFLLGIYCAGGYGGSVSAILINTPGTPHAAATMLDGHPLSKMGRTKAALKIALYASTFGGIFSALVLLFLGPQVAKISAQLGTAEYFMVCLFGMTIIAGVSGKSLVKGIIAACLGLLISCVGADPMTSYDRFTFGIPRLYLGLDLAVTLIGLFALVEIIGKAELKRSELNLHAGKIGNDDGKITEADMTWIGNPAMPEIVYGFGASLNYKGFDFSFLFQGGANRSSYLSGGWYFYPFQADRGPKFMGNVMTMFKDRWTVDNPDPHAFSPRLSYGADANNYKTSTWWQRDSGYLRLKNVEIGYTLPSAWASKLRCSSLRIYATGVNLFTVSKFISDYWDPETGADAYPMQRQVFVGVNLTF